VVALGIVFLGITIGQFPLIALIQHKVKKGVITLEEAQRFYEVVDFTGIQVNPAIGLVLLLISFIFGLVALFAVVEYMHGRRFKSLISARPVRWDKVRFAAGVWFVLTVIGELVMYSMYPGTYHLNINWSTWIFILLVALLILPLQTSFEELLVRGYLMQRIGVATNRAWIAVVITSVFFGVMHLGNPEIKEFGLGVMMTYYISVALCLAMITIVDDGLEYALGIHAATNIYGAAFVQYEGSALQADAMIRVDDVDPVLMLGLFYLMFIIFLLIVKRRSGLAGWSNLIRPVRADRTNSIDSEFNNTDHVSTEE
jgi:membrane protease YdiL (CAAX protease family)